VDLRRVTTPSGDRRARWERAARSGRCGAEARKVVRWQAVLRSRRPHENVVRPMLFRASRQRAWQGRAGRVNGRPKWEGASDWCRRSALNLGAGHLLERRRVRSGAPPVRLMVTTRKPHLVNGAMPARLREFPRHPSGGPALTHARECMALPHIDAFVHLYSVARVARSAVSEYGGR
jgi:hypothetical protein